VGSSCNEGLPFFIGAPDALGIGAASFWSVAEKDIAESPTAIAGTPKRMSTVNGQQTLSTMIVGAYRIRLRN